MEFKTLDDFVEEVKRFDRQAAKETESFEGDIASYYAKLQERFIGYMDTVHSLYRQGNAESENLAGHISNALKYVQIIIIKNCMKKATLDDNSNYNDFYDEFFTMYAKYEKSIFEALPKANSWKEYRKLNSDYKKRQREESLAIIQKYQTKPLQEKEFFEYIKKYNFIWDSQLLKMTREKYGTASAGEVKGDGIDLLSIARGSDWDMGFTLDYAYDCLIKQQNSAKPL